MSILKLVDALSDPELRRLHFVITARAPQEPFDPNPDHEQASNQFVALLPSCLAQGKFSFDSLVDEVVIDLLPKKRGSTLTFLLLNESHFELCPKLAQLLPSLHIIQRMSPEILVQFLLALRGNLLSSSLDDLSHAILDFTKLSVLSILKNLPILCYDIFLLLGCIVLSLTLSLDILHPVQLFVRSIGVTY